MTRLKTLLASLACTLLLAACAPPVRLDVPGPIREARPDPVRIDPQAAARGDVQTRQTLRRSDTPDAPGSTERASGLFDAERVPPTKGEAISVNIEGMPVPAFINEFFGTILGVSFQMDPAVARLSDLVTLRTSSPQAPRDFYLLAAEVLRSYGVSTEYVAGRVLFTPSPKGGDFQPPLVLSGRALPSVPVTHRPVFQLVELAAVRTADVTTWLKTAFRTDDLEVLDDLNRNAVVLYGKPDLVRQAAAAIRVLDQPYMRGRVSTQLEPAFVSADELARRLVDVLTTEGYGATLHSGAGNVQAAAVVVLPLVTSNAVLVFASDQRVLEHAVEWARRIDTPNPTAGGSSLFYYEVRNTRAEAIVATLSGVRSASAARIPARDAVSSGQANAANGANLATNPAAASQPAANLAPGALTSGDISGGTLVLDEPRNAIIFQGSAADWGRLLPLVRQMDKSPRQVMIEVTIAEIRLNDSVETGISWLAKADAGRFNGSLTSGVIGGAGGAGLNYLLDVAGQVRAQLRALAEDNRVTVLSTPRLMVKSGEEASIDVGDEVPTISSQSASPIDIDGTSNILQTVQYRKTGVILNIAPVIYSDNRVDLQIRQEVSEAQPVSSGGVQSPIISNRAVSTNLSLRDGSSVLIGGLIRNGSSGGESGVPLLKDIPILGNAFKTRTRGRDRSELIIMITPYIVENDAQATELTRAVSERYEMVELPLPAPTGPAPQPSRRVDGP